MDLRQPDTFLGFEVILSSLSITNPSPISRPVPITELATYPKGPAKASSFEAIFSTPNSLIIGN